MIAPIYAYSSLDFFSKIDKNYLYFQSARASLTFLLNSLRIEMILIPSYTCPTVLEAIKSSDADYDFIDLDENLDFEQNDLEYMLDTHKSKKIAILPTSLYNAPIKDYKTLYPDIIVIEDLSQSLPLYKQNSDFAIYSFGKSKLISCNGGGVLEGFSDIKTYEKLPSKCGFLKDYTISFITQMLLKYGWRYLYKYYESSKTDSYTFHKIEPKKICDIKKRWICSLLKKIDTTHRVEVSNRYLKYIEKDRLFKIPNDRAYLRMPVKKRVNSKEVSFMEPYALVYQEATKKRAKKLEIAETLSKECSFLPTHDLVKLKDIERFIKMSNMH